MIKTSISQNKFFRIFNLCSFNCSFTCLYICNRPLDDLLNALTTVPSPGCSIFPPGQYYLFKDYENIKLDENSFVYVLGLGDFTFYNLMILFIISPLPPIEIKIYIAIGAIIFIQIGYIVTIWKGSYWSEIKTRPVLQLPVIAFSAYTILLDVFMKDLNTNLC